MAGYSTVRIQAGDWQRYRTIRLQALQESPDAFGATYEVAVGADDAQWRERLNTIDDASQFPVFAIANDDVVGLAWGVIGNETPQTGHIYQMWVTPDHRRQGVGAMLMQALIDWFAQQSVKEIKLSVTVGNAPAATLYRQFGFVRAGESEPLRPGSNLMEQQYRMEL